MKFEKWIVNGTTLYLSGKISHLEISIDAKQLERITTLLNQHEIYHYVPLGNIPTDDGSVMRKIIISGSFTMDYFRKILNSNFHPVLDSDIEAKVRSFHRQLIAARDHLQETLRSWELSESEPKHTDIARGLGIPDSLVCGPDLRIRNGQRIRTYNSVLGLMALQFGDILVEDKD